MAELIEGKKIPAFELVSDSNEQVTQETLLGKRYVLFFYPKDMTPGCTQEACEFQENYKAFKKLKTEVFGISRDEQKSHLKFREKYGFEFPLLMDPAAKTADKFGIFKEKNMYGKKVMGVIRTTVVVDTKGVIEKLWNKVNVDGHVQEVLGFVSKN